MDQQEQPEEVAVIRDLIQTLETHLANGFDGRGQPLHALRRTSMVQLISEFHERLAALGPQALQTPQQYQDDCDDAVEVAIAFNDTARKFMERFKDS